MMVSRPVFRGCMGAWFRRLALAGLGLTGAAVLNIAGCPQPQFEEMIPGVTLKQITDITTDTNLTDDQKTQSLNDLGITDEQLIHILLTAPLPTPSTSGTTG